MVQVKEMKISILTNDLPRTFITIRLEGDLLSGSEKTGKKPIPRDRPHRRTYRLGIED